MNALEYTILRYRHSYASGEILNLGILVYFKDLKQIKFHKSVKIGAFSKLYPDVELYFIKKYVNEIEKTVFQLNEQLRDDIYISQLGLDEIVNQFILVRDSSSISFDLSEVSLYKSPATIEDHLIKKFLVTSKHISRNIDERIIAKKLYQSLYQRIAYDSFSKTELDQKIKKKFIIQGSFYQETFEFAWRNEKLNLVSPISFDVKAPEFIKRKSQQLYAVLGNLSTPKNIKEYNFDIIVHRPQNRDLYNEYDKAIRFIRDSSEAVRIKEFEKLDSYAEEIINTAKVINIE
jgi:hypothetical protein